MPSAARSAPRWATSSQKFSNAKEYSVRREHYIRNHLVRIRMGETIDYTVPASPTYGNPTKPLDYAEPLPANGNRTPAPKSPLNYRGQIVVDNEVPQIVTFESSLEKKAILILRADRRVASLRTQYPTVEYLGSDGELHEHTFDAMVRRIDGKRIVIAAKPILKLIENDLIGTLKVISRDCLKGVADAVTFVTEKYASDEAAHNANEILLSRRLRNDDEYLIALNIVKSVRGPVTFRALFAGADVPAHRRTALWCLIDEQLLRPVTPGRIEDTTLVIAAL
jgi:hypothetical protein